MTKLRQKEILTQIMMLVTEMAEDDSDTPVTAEPKPEKVELLTIKECAELIPGLSVNTIRELEKQGKIESIRAGKGIRGKILIYKDSLLKLKK
ncbi:MAG: helix-turn-helix domain-containing protein [Oscillospiraceae bacterium]|nr:helix-turn-helix domain-containing protein [Oscillospiraceae bacterium]